MFERTEIEEAVSPNIKKIKLEFICGTVHISFYIVNSEMSLCV